MWELKLSPIPANFKPPKKQKGVLKEKKNCIRPGCSNKVKYHSSRAKYCTPECYAKSKMNKSIPCKGCGKNFHPTKKRKYFCTSKCFLDSLRVQRYCQNPECGQLIKDNNNVRKYCSVKCFNHVRQKDIIRYSNCQNNECGAPLKNSQIKSNQKYCCHPCYTKVRNQKTKDSIGKLISLRNNKNWEYPRRYIKLEKKWMLVSRYTWENANGPIPEGYYIGYKDGDTFNDQDINNLYLVESVFNKKEN